jgi:hypothetical protein
MILTTCSASTRISSRRWGRFLVMAAGQFGNSNSLKAVLPVVAPELSYQRLAVQNGSQALVIWEEIIRKGISTRHLGTELGQLGLSQDKMKGRIGHGGVVVNGEFICVSQASMVGGLVDSHINRMAGTNPSNRC